MSPENCWARMVGKIPLDEFERRYAELFDGDTGKLVKPLRLTLGRQIIQARYQYSDREMVEQLKEPPTTNTLPVRCSMRK